jgi:signal transduction histidine kinase
VSRSIFTYLRDHFRLSLSAFYFYIPASVLAVPLIFWTEEFPATITRLLLVGLAVTLSTFFLFWFLIYIFEKSKISSRLIFGTLILLLVGIYRGLALYYLFEFLGYQNPTSLSERVLNSIFNVFVWLGISSIFLENRRRFIRRYRALLTQILILKLRNSSDFQPGYTYIEDHIIRMQKRLKSSIEQIRSTAEIGSPEILIAKEFRKEIEEELKPFNQRLWLKSTYDQPFIRFSLVLKTAVTELKFKFPVTAAVYLAILVVNTILILDSRLAIFYGLLSISLFLLLNECRLSLIQRFYGKTRTINLIFLVLVGFAVGISTTLILDCLGLNHSYSAALLIAPILPVLIVSSSFIELAISDRRSLMEKLSKESVNLNQEFLEKMHRGNAASYLHNSLQSELSSIALQLESIAKNPNLGKNQQVTQIIESFVSRSSREDYRDFLETPKARMERVTASWEGIAKIDITIDNRIFEDHSRASIVTQLIQESIANAVRSGSADHIAITGNYDKESFKMIVVDNGHRAVSAEKRGLGSEWLDSIAVTEWTLEQSLQGSTLRVEI